MVILQNSMCMFECDYWALYVYIRKYQVCVTSVVRYSINHQTNKQFGDTFHICIMFVIIKLPYKKKNRVIVSVKHGNTFIADPSTI